METEPPSATLHVMLEGLLLRSRSGAVQPYHQTVLLEVLFVQVGPIAGRLNAKIVPVRDFGEKPKRVRRKQDVIGLCVQREEDEHPGLRLLCQQAGRGKQERKTRRSFHWPAPQKTAFLKSCTKSGLSNRPP